MSQNNLQGHLRSRKHKNKATNPIETITEVEQVAECKWNLDFGFPLAHDDDESLGYIDELPFPEDAAETVSYLSETVDGTEALARADGGPQDPFQAAFSYVPEV